MRIQHRMVGDVAIIDLMGNLKLGDGVELLRGEVNRLIKQDQTWLVLNLAGVPYMDSTGLGEVVRTYTTALTHGGGLRLVRPTQRVRQLLIVARVYQVLGVFESEEDAVRSFPPSAG
jgi:anti-sigma B factor antagonist